MAGVLVMTEQIYQTNVQLSQPLIRFVEYNQDCCDSHDFFSMNDFLAYTPSHDTVHWLNVYDVDNQILLQQVGEKYRLHPLVLEDIYSKKQRPKLENYGNYFFFVGRLFQFSPQGHSLIYEQLYLIIGKDFVISFQQHDTDDIFHGVYAELSRKISPLRTRQSDFLVYTLLDHFTDQYITVVDQMNDKVEAADTLLISNTSIVRQSYHGDNILKQIHRMKHQSLSLRKAILPLRDALLQLLRNDNEYFNEETRVYLRDVYDHTLHQIESLETGREIIAGMIDIYMSGLSNRLNIQMRILTVITIIFMPLTLITGVYGMNFTHMPVEITWQYGFYFVIAVMLFIAGSLCWYFKRHKWFNFSA